MIVTLTPNPSLDRTVELETPLAPGQVQRALRVHTEPGGKGVNISRALSAAEAPTLAVLPGDPEDPVISALRALPVAHHAVPIGAPLRINTAITDPQGETTKINEPGPQLAADQAAALTSALLDAAAGASWTALAGSLPPGLEHTYYAALTESIHALPATGTARRVAVDASGAALAAAISAGPDLIKPNGEELLEACRLLCTEDPVLTQQLAQLTGDEVEADLNLVTDLVRRLQRLGARTTLVTLGARGALLVPEDPQHEVLIATGPAIEARSTVGAGDASLAGYLTAHAAGAEPAECLRHASAHGRAAASLPGSRMPSPDTLRLDDVVVEAFHPHMNHPHMKEVRS